MRKLLNSVSLLSVLIAAPIVTMSAATAEDKLEALTKSEDNWAMQGKNYSSNHYSTLTQVNAENVKNLKVAWSFSTGLLSGHEGSPLVVDGKMYVHTSFPNNTFALDLDDPTRILWQHKPKQNAAARAVACCDIVNRGLAYWPGDGKAPALIVKTLLDGHVVALNAKHRRGILEDRKLRLQGRLHADRRAAYLSRTLCSSAARAPNSACAAT